MDTTICFAALDTFVYFEGLRPSGSLADSVSLFYSTSLHKIHESIHDRSAYAPLDSCLVCGLWIFCVVAHGIAALALFISKDCVPRAPERTLARGGYRLWLGIWLMAALLWPLRLEGLRYV